MIYTCNVCGYKYDDLENESWSDLGDDWACPVCSVGKDKFTAEQAALEVDENIGWKKYRCEVCEYIYDENDQGGLFADLSEGYKCPVCSAAKIYFKEYESPYEGGLDLDDKAEPKEGKDDLSKDMDLSYPSGFARDDDSLEPHMKTIHAMAKSGKYVSEPMKTRLPVVSWDDILFLGAQLHKLPLDDKDHVNTTTVIGKKARQPMVIENPVYISHMSFGALSREMKISMSRGSAVAETAMCSGEGGILSESMEESYKYIFEYVPNKYSVTDENLRNADAIEIKIGQGTKPGMGGHLPGSKVTREIAQVRQKPLGQDIISPSKFMEIKSREDLKGLVDGLREKSQGRPIGIKIAAGRIEEDLAVVAYANPDFVTIDGRGGSTGSSPKLLKDSTSVPTIYALYRAKKYLDDNKLDIDLVITGGLRVASDFAKALAMGADAVAIGTAAMMASVCQQYRVCNNGKCPVGCATQDEELRKRLDVDNSARRLYNFLKVSLDEIKTFARITGNNDIHDLSVVDLCTTNSEISNHTNIKHA